MRLLFIVLVGLLALFQYEFWLGENSYIDYEQAKVDVAQRTAENAQLTQRNQLITAEVNDLRKSGGDAIAERARFEHNMVGENEHFYRILKPENNQQN